MLFYVYFVLLFYETALNLLILKCIILVQVSPPSVRGTYGSFIQIATCIGILAALVAGLPVHSVSGW